MGMCLFIHAGINKITHGLYDGDVTAGFLQVQEDSKTKDHKYSLFKRHSNLNMSRGPME